jgi:hypothetical protein
MKRQVEKFQCQYTFVSFFFSLFLIRNMDYYYDSFVSVMILGFLFHNFVFLLSLIIVWFCFYDLGLARRPVQRSILGGRDDSWVFLDFCLYYLCVLSCCA